MEQLAAPRLMQQAEALSIAMGRMLNRSPAATTLGEVYLRASLLVETREHAWHALALARTSKERSSQAYALHLLGDLDLHDAPLDAVLAETHYQQALALATELGMRPLQAHCHRGLGMLYRQTGQAEPACAELSTAIDIYRDMEMTCWLPKTAVALAEVKGR